MIFTITGPSGSGKTSLVRALMRKKDSPFREIISCTTRPPREKEVDGVDYHFMTVDEFKNEMKKGNFVEHVEFGGNYYGTHIDDINKVLQENRQGLIVVDRKGAVTFKNKYGSKLHTIYLSLSKDKAYKRLKRRDGCEKAQTRQQVDEQSGLFDKKGYDCILDADRKRHEVVYDFMNYYIAKKTCESMAEKK